MKTLKLNDQTHIPVLGLGTWQLEGKVAQEAVEVALETGYRHIDTADAYGNHAAVAEGIKKSGLPRDEIFLTTKLWYTELTQNQIYDSAHRFLNELETDYIDLLLIHWPNKSISYNETLLAMKRLQDQKVIKAIGVSNFTIQHLKGALETGVPITNNQVELHPSFSQPELQHFCHDHNIVITAYSPIGQGDDLFIPIIEELAEKYQRSPSQVILNWIISKGMVAIPKSSNSDHIRDNFQALDWNLSSEDIVKIDNAKQGNRIVHPSFSEFGL